jgi:hypothetical protein
MSPASDRSSARRLNYIGAGLIALAFVGPSVASVADLGNPFTVGEHIARTLGALALAGFVAWLVVRKRSTLAKARARRWEPATSTLVRTSTSPQTGQRLPDVGLSLLHKRAYSTLDYKP